MAAQKAGILGEADNSGCLQVAAPEGAQEFVISPSSGTIRDVNGRPVGPPASTPNIVSTPVGTGGIPVQRITTPEQPVQQAPSGPPAPSPGPRARRILSASEFQGQPLNTRDISTSEVADFLMRRLETDAELQFVGTLLNIHFQGLAARLGPSSDPEASLRERLSARGRELLAMCRRTPNGFPPPSFRIDQVRTGSVEGMDDAYVLQIVRAFLEQGLQARDFMNRFLDPRWQPVWEHLGGLPEASSSRGPTPQGTPVSHTTPASPFMRPVDQPRRRPHNRRAAHAAGSADDQAEDAGLPLGASADNQAPIENLVTALNFPTQDTVPRSNQSSRGPSPHSTGSGINSRTQKGGMRDPLTKRGAFIGNMTPEVFLQQTSHEAILMYVHSRWRMADAKFWIDWHQQHRGQADVTDPTTPQAGWWRVDSLSSTLKNQVKARTPEAEYVMFLDKDDNTRYFGVTQVHARGALVAVEVDEPLKVHFNRLREEAIDQHDAASAAGTIPEGRISPKDKCREWVARIIPCVHTNCGLLFGNRDTLLNHIRRDHLRLAGVCAHCLNHVSYTVENLSAHLAKCPRARGRDQGLSDLREEMQRIRKRYVKKKWAWPGDSSGQAASLSRPAPTVQEIDAQTSTAPWDQLSASQATGATAPPALSTRSGSLLRDPASSQTGRPGRREPMDPGSSGSDDGTLPDVSVSGDRPPSSSSRGSSARRDGGRKEAQEAQDRDSRSSRSGDRQSSQSRQDEGRSGRRPPGEQGSSRRDAPEGSPARSDNGARRRNRKKSKSHRNGRKSSKR